MSVSAKELLKMTHNKVMEQKRKVQVCRVGRGVASKVDSWSPITECGKRCYHV